MKIEITKELLDEAQEMQKDMHGFVDVVIERNKDISYQAASALYWCLKITELKQEIRDLRHSGL